MMLAPKLTPPAADKPTLYRELNLELSGLFAGERNAIANAANMSALIFDRLPDLNWAGFYFMDATTGGLVVGPFQGRPACVRIAIGKGVCGTAVARRAAIVVPDVDVFPGHIACDSASRSELVIPLAAGDEVLGVLDLDAPIRNRFDEADRDGLAAAVKLWIEASDLAAFHRV
jgi:GAF domain-containing protein